MSTTIATTAAAMQSKSIDCDYTPLRVRKIKASRPAQSQPPAAWTNKSGWSAQEQNSKAARPGDGPLQTAYLTLGESVALFFLPQNRTGEECGAKRD